MSDGLSAAVANTTLVRHMLRNRAPYEVANNTFAQGIISSFGNALISYGPVQTHSIRFTFQFRQRHLTSNHPVLFPSHHGRIKVLVKKVLKRQGIGY